MEAQCSWQEWKARSGGRVGLLGGRTEEGLSSETKTSHPMQPLQIVLLISVSKFTWHYSTAFYKNANLATHSDLSVGMRLAPSYVLIERGLLRDEPCLLAHTMSASPAIPCPVWCLSL